MAAEIIEAQIADLGFDSFSYTSQGVDAFIAESLFDEDALKESLSYLDGAEFNIEYTIETVAQQNWNALWESDFEPVVVRDTVTVKAVYHKNLPRTRYNVTIDPRMSFGSGHHQTTCMMIEGLLDESQAGALKGASLLDMGCGTGILAIVASKLGIAEALAVDIDQLCVSSTSDNARRNRVGKRINVLLGDASCLPEDSFDIVLANINRNILLSDMASYVRALRNGHGRIFFSGFFSEDVPMLEEAAARLGFETYGRKEREGWAMLMMRG